jgi:hypothetical protein
MGPAEKRKAGKTLKISTFLNSNCIQWKNSHSVEPCNFIFIYFYIYSVTATA